MSPLFSNCKLEKMLQILSFFPLLVALILCHTPGVNEWFALACTGFQPSVGLHDYWVLSALCRTLCGKMPAEVRGRHLHKMSFNIFCLCFPRLVGEAYCWQSDRRWSDDLHWSLTAALAEWTCPSAKLWDSCLPRKQSLRVLWDVRKAELCKEPRSPQVTASDCSLKTVARPWKGDKEKHENNHSQSRRNILLITFYYHLITCVLSKNCCGTFP